MSWNYSDHSHNVKVLGGPEKYVDTIKKFSFKNGQASTNRRWIQIALPSLMLLVPLAVRGAIALKQDISKRLENADNLNIKSQDFANEEQESTASKNNNIKNG